MIKSNVGRNKSKHPWLYMQKLITFFLTSWIVINYNVSVWKGLLNPLKQFLAFWKANFTSNNIDKSIHNLLMHEFNKDFFLKYCILAACSIQICYRWVHVKSIYSLYCFQGMDMKFLRAALTMSKMAVYSLHKTSTREVSSSSGSVHPSANLYWCFTILF